MFILVAYVIILITGFFPAKGQILSFCPDPIEGEECSITCTTPDHHEDIFFLKTSDPSTNIASCISGTCFVVNSYTISQPNGTTTVLRFNHTRGNAEEWLCRYGSSSTTKIMKWGTYPTTITATGFPTNTNITSEQEADVKLTCLYSENPPVVTVIHTDSGSTSITFSTPVTCTITNETCTDSDFDTYTCKVIISPSNDLLCTETFSLGVSVKISNIQTPSMSLALGTDISYECQTLSTYLDSTSGVSQSTLLITTDGGIHSLNTLSNLPDETMMLSSISPTVAETSYVLSQAITFSSNISLYHTSNNYTSALLMTTQTSSIFDSFISLSSSSTLVSAGYTINNSFKSIDNIMTSKLSILKTRSAFYNSFSTVDDLESSNLISLSPLHISDRPNGISLLNGNMIASFETASLMSSLQRMSSMSHSDSLAQDLRSKITSPYGIVSTQKETGSHVDHTPLISFTNLQSTLGISYQPSLSPSSATYMTELSTQALLLNHSMQSEESLTTIPTPLSNIDTNSMLPTTLSIDEALILYSSSKYTTFVDFKSTFDINFEAEDVTIGHSPNKIIDKMTFYSIAESIEAKRAKISTSDDFSLNSLINSPITSFGNSSKPLSVRPTIVDISTSMNRLFGTFVEKPNTLSVNSLKTQSLLKSEIIGIITANSIEISNENTETLFQSLWIVPSSSLHLMNETLSPVSSVELESVSKAISSDDSVLFDTFSILRFGSPPFESTAYISTKSMSSIFVNSGRYSSATNIHLPQPNAFVTTTLPSVHSYVYTSDIDISSSLLGSSSVNEHTVLTNDPTLTKTTKVIAISVTVVGCILFVAISILVLFVLKLLQCKPKSNVAENRKEFSITDSKNLRVNDREQRGFRYFDTHYGLPTRYYDNTAMSSGSRDDQFTCYYSTNWDDIK